jgi:hypothetical protein
MPELLGSTSPRITHINYDPRFRDISQQYSLLSSLPTQARTYVTPYQSNNNLDRNSSYDPFDSQVYDPVAGFVIFYDFIVNLPANIDLCQLTAYLQHPQWGLGIPSHLPPIKCDPYIDESTEQRMGLASISIRQPVPRFARL